MISVLLCSLPFSPKSSPVLIKLTFCVNDTRRVAEWVYKQTIVLQRHRFRCGYLVPWFPSKPLLIELIDCRGKNHSCANNSEQRRRTIGEKIHNNSKQYQQKARKRCTCLPLIYLSHLQWIHSTMRKKMIYSLPDTETFHSSQGSTLLCQKQIDYL
jgi:hypothetical protein